MAGEEAVVSGTFSATVSVASVDIVLLALNFKNTKLEAIDMSNNISIDVTQFVDRQYENA